MMLNSGFWIETLCFPIRLRRTSLGIWPCLQGLLFLGILPLSPEPALAQPDPRAVIVLLNHEGEPTTQITDGDTVQIRATFPKDMPRAREITLLLDDTPVGACRVPVGGRTCETDAVPSFGWYWGVDGKSHDSRRIGAKDTDGGHITQSNTIRGTRN